MNDLRAVVGKWLSPYLPDSTLSCENPFCTHVRRWAARDESVQLNGKRFCSPPCFRAGARSLLERGFARQRVTQANPHRIPLGLFLLSREKITADDLKVSLARQHGTGLALGEVLQQQGLVHESDITSAVAAQWGLPVFASAPPATVTSLAIPRELLLRHGMVPLHWDERQRTLFLGFVRTVNYAAIEGIEIALDCRVQSCIVAGSTFRSSVLEREANVEQSVFSFGNNQDKLIETMSNYLLETGSQEIRVSSTSEYVWARLRISNRAEWMNLLFDLARSKDTR